MRTYAQIFEECQKRGIVDKFRTYHEIYNNLLKLGKSTAGINWELSSDDIIFLKSMSHELTGVRVGNCGGCIHDMIRNMYRWTMDYQARTAETKKRKRNEG